MVCNFTSGQNEGRVCDESCQFHLTCTRRNDTVWVKYNDPDENVAHKGTKKKTRLCDEH